MIKYGMSQRPSNKALKFLQVYGDRQPSSQFWYVNIHPLADEKDVLARLGMTPDKCLICDLWWAVGSHVAFVGIYNDPIAQPSVTFRKRRPGEEVDYSFIILTKSAPLNLSVVERILGRLAKWLDSHDADKHLFTRTFLLSQEDIGVDG